MKRSICVLSTCLVLSLTALSPLDALAAEERGAWSEAGLGVASLVTSVFWGTAKTVCAVGGTLTAGFAYLFTGFNERPARAILQASLRGDYVITPNHLTGKQTLTFIGRDPQYEPHPYDDE
ncbi:MAG: hypothetical protein JRG76_00990 [Deltaproteobacteria bacterium]|jgi:hypothetical protein|nr:hypothetical protein [Deltaproteobacteria bacterium]MBW2413058.1 hypothetical protein [Deltaproteobacteria bacterium]